MKIPDRRNLARTFRRAVYRLGFAPTRQGLAPAQRETLRTVCVFLGPYRNLTTLTASLLGLHPTCQVLNHGGEQVFDEPALDFLTTWDGTRFDRFCRFAIDVSQRNERTLRGASIAASHAFRRDAMRSAYERRYGDALVKERIECIVWKESHRAANAIRAGRRDVDELIRLEPRLRFLMPIRSPLDCARSNFNRGYAKFFAPGPNATALDLLDGVLREIAWFEERRRRHPERLFRFFQDEMDERTLRALAAFLEIDAEPRWLGDALECARTDEGYEHEPELIERYRALVRRHFHGDDTLAERLLGFAGPAPIGGGRA